MTFRGVEVCLNPACDNPPAFAGWCEAHRAQPVTLPDPKGPPDCAACLNSGVCEKEGDSWRCSCPRGALVAFEPAPDLINHPPHYTAGRFESIEVIEDQGHGRGFCYGNALKYLHRAPHKGSELADLKKAAWYVARLIKQYGEHCADAWHTDTDDPRANCPVCGGDEVT